MTNSSTGFGRLRVSNTLKLGVLCAMTVAAAACSTKEAPGPLEPTSTVGRVRLVNLINDATRGTVNASLAGLVFTVNLQYAQSAGNLARIAASHCWPRPPLFLEEDEFVHGLLRRALAQAGESEERVR